MLFVHTAVFVLISPSIIRLVSLVCTMFGVCSIALAENSIGASAHKPLTIISLDYCADQYTLKLAPQNAQLMLSSNATQTFSHLKEQAQAHPQQAARLEYIVRSKPDFVVRSYGGGALMSQRLSSLGIPVIQLQFSQDFESIYNNVLMVSKAFGRVEQGQQLVEQTRARLSSIQKRRVNQTKMKSGSQVKSQANKIPSSLLYLTASGATAGQKTLINNLIKHAGFANYIQRDGWPSLSLEQLSLSQPEHIATAFFNPKQYLHFWSSIHHPVAKQLLAASPVTELNTSTLACAAWYTVNSVEKLADARSSNE